MIVFVAPFHKQSTGPGCNPAFTQTAGKGSNIPCKPESRRNCDRKINTFFDIVTSENCQTFKIRDLWSVGNVPLCYLPDISKGREEATVSSASPIQFSRV